MRAEVRQGLDRAGLLPTGTGYVELSAGVRADAGGAAAFARGELGWRPRENLSVFAFGEGTAGLRQPAAFMAGVGARLNF